MSIRSACIHRLAVVLGGLWLLIPALALAAPGTEKTEPAKTETPAEKVRKVLDQATDLELENQSLDAAISQLREQFKLNIVLDRWALQQMGYDPASLILPTVHLKNVKLRSALRTAFSQYNLSYAILGGTVLITTEPLALQRQMRQHVNVDLEGMQLAQALK
jgi:hypothetical protein